ncbi:MAG: hypothetical protein IT372_21840 [Polyangiaceae bacterium]|nr:hypothetical protein [Polyangiaceae bacterium]
MPSRPVLLLVLLALLAGCASPPPASAPAPAPAPASAAASPAAAAHAPRPFTAEQIRAAMPAGHRIRYRMEAAGEPATVELWEVVAADAEQMTMSSKVHSEDGKLLKDEGNDTSSWTALVEHATFPAAATTIREADVEVPAGKYPAIIYEVRERGDGGVEIVKRFHFAKTMPGPPVLLTIETGGKVVRSMTLLERR